MKLTVLFAVAIVSIIASNNATAQTKSERCEAYARNAAGSTPTTTGAARGAVVGSISGNAGRGAGVGAIVGGTRRVAQRGRLVPIILQRMHEPVNRGTCIKTDECSRDLIVR